MSALNIASILLIVAALAVAVLANAPFPLPATYAIQPSGAGHRITFNKDGKTFTWASNIRCIRAPCHEAGGEGTFAFRNGQVTLRATLGPKEKVSQTWALGPATRDLNMSRIWGIKLVRKQGDKADFFPLPSGGAEEGYSWTRDAEFDA
ncbi:hypothetical protein BCR44DRAFT_36376, partial [Catenaria anguillulae PL171]